MLDGRSNKKTPRQKQGQRRNSLSSERGWGLCTVRQKLRFKTRIRLRLLHIMLGLSTVATPSFVLAGLPTKAVVAVAIL